MAGTVTVLRNPLLVMMVALGAATMAAVVSAASADLEGDGGP